MTTPTIDEKFDSDVYRFEKDFKSDVRKAGGYGFLLGVMGYGVYRHFFPDAQDVQYLSLLTSGFFGSVIGITIVEERLLSKYSLERRPESEETSFHLIGEIPPQIEETGNRRYYRRRQ